MRTATIVSSLSLLAACQVSAPVAAPVADGSGSRAAVAVDAALRGAAEIPEVRAVDPHVAALLKATFRDYAVRRQVALENLANVRTTAYKRRVVATAERPNLGSDGSPVPIPAGAQSHAVFAGGPLLDTGRMLDLAIDGDGFFAVIAADGAIGYTREGNAHVNRDGKLVTVQGYVFVPEITIPSDALDVAIDPTGKVCGRTAGSPDTMTGFGDLTLHRFINAEGLRSDGAVWRETENAGSPMAGQPGTHGLGLLKQGFLEGSNVQFSDEMIELQVLERQHEALTEVMRKLGLIAP